MDRQYMRNLEDVLVRHLNSHARQKTERTDSQGHEEKEVAK
jgi:hypothetical protein